MRDIFNEIANLTKPEIVSEKCDHCDTYVCDGKHTDVGYFCSPHCEKTWRKIAKEETDNFYLENLEEYAD